MKDDLYTLNIYNLHGSTSIKGSLETLRKAIDERTPKDNPRYKVLIDNEDRVVISEPVYFSNGVPVATCVMYITSPNGERVSPVERIS